MKRITSLILAFVLTFATFSTAFAADGELPYDPRIDTVEVNTAEEISEEETETPVIPDEPETDTEIPEEPVIPQEPEVEPEIPDNNGIVAEVSVCSSMSVPVIAGHTYIYVHNLSDKPIQVGLYEVPVGQGVSVGTFSVSVSDGWGLYYNIEAFRENHDNAEHKIWSKTRQLNASQLEKLSNNLRNYLNHWDPFFNCAFFAYSVWDVSVGDLLIPLVIPVFSHLMIMVAGGRKGVLDLYCPTEDQVFRQRGTGSNARLEPVSASTLR